MAIQRIARDGHGQIELNNVAFRRDGRIEAQCALHNANATTGFVATDWIPTKACENGMLLAVDKSAIADGKMGDVLFPVPDYPIALVYSAEHLYDERLAGALKHQAAYWNAEEEYFYPRLGYLSVGDSFTTNTVCYDTATYADDDTLFAVDLAATPLYGGVEATTANTTDTLGSIKLSATKPAYGPVLKAVAFTTMPDGQKAVKFHVIAD